ncbi:S-layer homology domain-containing protein [Bacillus tropicus]|nr:S-layer homology domain-containing protein [Bacillus tropicus]MEC3077989.1 S-layer homology domain-containing protein [Bacillus tropicus]
MLATTLTPMIDAQAEDKKFNDVPQDHWSFNAITDLANKNIVAGYGNGIFGFGDNITRGQVARMIYNYLKPADDPNVKNPFNDVKGHMFEKEILSLSKAGIMSGYGDGNFGPDNILTREQLAAVLTRAFNLKATATPTFKDVEKNYWATNAISALQENKIAAGTGNNMFEPKMVVTREQYAQFLYNAINMKEKPITKPEKDKNGGTTTEPNKPEKDKNGGTTTEPNKPEKDKNGGTTTEPNKPEKDKNGGTTTEPDKPEKDKNGGTTTEPENPGKDNNNGTTNQEDKAPPTLNKVEVGKKTYQAGESVQVSVEAEDDVSGVKYVFIDIKGPGGEEKRETANYDSQTKKWIANIPLSSYAQSGEYIVSTIVMYDNADHPAVYWGGKDFNANFNVENDLGSDQQPPTLNKVEVGKKTYQAGESVQVSVEAEDDVSGVKYVFIDIKGPGGEEKRETANYDSQTKKWIANIPLSSYAQSGEYMVSTIVMYDNADHPAVYWGGKDFNVNFNVTAN